jgi:hypothetical protein
MCHFGGEWKIHINSALGEGDKDIEVDSYQVKECAVSWRYLYGSQITVSDVNHARFGMGAFIHVY